MADEKNLGQNDGNQDETDYKALYEQAKADADKAKAAARKWEERSKANKAKADKYDAATAGEESLEDRIAKLEADKLALQQANARRELVAKVAAEVGISEALVDSLSGTDEETLTKQAQAFAELKPKGAPSAPEAGKFPRNESGRSNADVFGELVEKSLSR